jgi:hypothetical protein
LTKVPWNYLKVSFENTNTVTGSNVPE